MERLNLLNFLEVIADLFGGKNGDQFQNKHDVDQVLLSLYRGGDIFETIFTYNTPFSPSHWLNVGWRNEREMASEGRHEKVYFKHVNLYDNYIDVLELNKDILCDIYIYRKEYKNNLRYLINNFDLDLHSNAIDGNFVKNRLDCGQKCVISPNHCHYCYRIGQLYTKLHKIENNKK